MEEINGHPFQINRFSFAFLQTDCSRDFLITKGNAGVVKLLNASNLSTNKRKFQHEASDFPLPKHACLVKTSISAEFPSDSLLDTEDLKNRVKEKSNNNSHSRYDQINEGSAKDSNTFSEDVDSIMSVFNKSKTDLQCLKICPYDRPSTSSVNWGGGFSDTSDDFNTLYTSPKFEEHQGHYGNSEDKTGGSDECEDKELEDLLYSNGIIPNDFVLSSGRWNVNQDTQGEEKLTIDKEFEQYFSMLML